MPDRLSSQAYFVLLALGEETRHGYAMIQRFAELTGGTEELLPGTLYATLARMVETGLIQEARAPRGAESGGPPRRHYKVTPIGRAQADAETERLRRLVRAARRAWSGEPGLAR